MKKWIAFSLVFFSAGCATTDTNEPLPPAQQAFAVPEISTPTVTAEDIAATLNSSACVRCQFSDEENRINQLIGHEMETQREAYEALLADGIDAEKAAELVYVKKQYGTAGRNPQKPTRQMK